MVKPPKEDEILKAIDRLEKAIDVATNILEATPDLDAIDSMSEEELRVHLAPASPPEAPTSNVVPLLTPASKSARERSMQDEAGGANTVDRFRLRMAASSQTDAQAPHSGTGLLHSEFICIDGIDCQFEYSTEPFQVYLRGAVPSNTSAFVAGGKSWQLRLVEVGFYAVAELELWHIDEFGGEGRWA